MKRIVYSGEPLKKLNPKLEELYEISSVASSNAKDLLPACKISEEKTDEFKELLELIHDREERIKYPPKFKLERQSVYLLYNIIRALKPSIIVETGVADGYSTFFILHALEKNGKGRLVSFDITDKVGALLDDSEKDIWNLVVLKGNKKHEFMNYIKELGKIDLFLHDSDYSYGWQYFEYNTVYQFMGENSIFMSDDVDSSYAFIDFCRKKGVKPAILIELRKVLGCFAVHHI